MVLCAFHQFLHHGHTLGQHCLFPFLRRKESQVICMGLMQGVQLCMAYEAGEGVLFHMRPVSSEFRGWSQEIAAHAGMREQEGSYASICWTCGKLCMWSRTI